MKNETKSVPQPTGLDIMEAFINGWQPHIDYLPVDFADDSLVTGYYSNEYFSRSIEEVTHLEKSKDCRLSWPEYYAKHCLSRPFVPEEWGWEESESGKWLLHGSRGRGYCIRHSIIANEIYFLTQDTDVIEITIPTAREYITLAEMLGIETTKTEKS